MSVNIEIIYTEPAIEEAATDNCNLVPEGLKFDGGQCPVCPEVKQSGVIDCFVN